MTTKIRTEEPYLNILRTIAINLVILLHCISAYITDTNIFGTDLWWVLNITGGLVRMGVPLFFAISGYLLLSDSRTLDIKSFYKRRLSRILVPFIIWDILYFTAKCIITGQELRVGLFFTELLLQGSQYHLWFVYKLAGLYLLAPFLKRIVDNCTAGQTSLLLLIIMLPVSIFRLISGASPVYVYLFGTLIEGYAGFFILGYLLGTYEIKRTARLIIYLLGLVAFISGCIGNYLLSSREQLNLIFNEGYSITSFIMAGAFFLLIKQLKPAEHSHTNRFFSTYSKLTYGIYLSHIFVLSLLSRYTAGLPRQLSIPLCFVGTAVLTAFAVYAVSKIKYINKILM
ncbi:MAG: acyltransferase [Papillibacter sp.]|jgi:surface polysaccharide O-acyltransferase-like enzyme|nr:acyltransferase [Papillibacter sp.]